MALSKKQLDILKALPGIDQKLVSAYEKGGQNLTAEERQYVESKAPNAARVREISSQPFVSVGSKNKQAQTGVLKGTLGDSEEEETDIDAKDPVSRITNFNKALNTGISMARQQRQDSVLDMAGGMIPSGALPSSSFASILNSFNSGAAPLEASLMKSATDFALQEEEQKADTKNQIRDLALAVIEAGGDQATMNAVLSFTESGDIDGAMKAAGAALDAGSDEIRQVGKNLLKVSKDGTYEVLFTASGGGGNSSAPSEKETSDENLRTLPFGPQGAPTEVAVMDFYSASTDELDAEMKKLLGDSSAKIKKNLTGELQKDFMNDWVYMMEKGGDYIDPVEYFENVWSEAAGLTPKTEKEEKKEDTSRNPLGT